MNFNEGIEFDPGFTLHLSLISREIESFYRVIMSFPKFPQKRQQFKAYSQKLWKMIERNIGFYSACILWAGIAKNHPEKLILNNICYGADYIEADNIAEVVFVREYLEQYKKDVKYYIGQEIEIPQIFATILDDYEVFIKQNEGFVKVSKADDLKLPTCINPITNEQEAELLPMIEKVIETGNFNPMIEYYNKVK